MSHTTFFTQSIKIAWHNESLSKNQKQKCSTFTNLDLSELTPGVTLA